MKNTIFSWRQISIILFFAGILSLQTSATDKQKNYKPDNQFFQYTGRIDFSDPCLPRFWAAGVYINAWFKGSNCEITLNDEVPWENTHNYVSVQIDNEPVQRIKLSKKINTLNFQTDSKEKRHKITICKSTESGIGYMEFSGMQCQQLLAPPQKPKRKIEFYGNSITCGTGSDTSVIPCDSAEWYDQHNAYMSYGPRTARALNAQWMLSSVSGIGLIHSCCNMDITMPDVYDKLDQRDNKYLWNFSNYQPDVVCIALGQNDGIQDSTLFCSSYVKFLHTLREKYPESTIICLTSPMGDKQLTSVLKNYLSSIVSTTNEGGDDNIYSFFFSRSYNNGCGGHPDLEQHGEIAEELTDFIKKTKGW